MLAYFFFFAIMQIMSQQYSDRVRRASKLIMLEWLVPIFVRKRATDFFLPQIDPQWFDRLGKKWGVWKMSETEFSDFEEQKLKSYVDTLLTVSPAFKDKVFAKVNEVLRMGAKLSGGEDMEQQEKPQWQPIEKLSLIARVIDGMLQATNEQYETLQPARQQPYVLDDYTVNRTIKVYIDQKDDLWVFDEQLMKWKAGTLTSAQRTEVERLQGQMQKLHEMNTIILSLAEELKEVTIERLLEKDDAEVGLEYLLGTLGKPKKKPTR